MKQAALVLNTQKSWDQIRLDLDSYWPECHLRPIYDLSAQLPCIGIELTNMKSGFIIQGLNKYPMLLNKLASLEATLIQNYELLAHRGKV